MIALMERRVAVRILLALTAAIAVAGCSLDARDLPLPGTGVSGSTRTIKATFDNALNLTEGARVVVNGIEAGRVTGISTDGYKAVATLTVKKSVALTDKSTARLRYDTPLGELFVDFESPKGGVPLPDGATMSVAQTSTAPSVEDALASASLLINGGGIGDLGVIVDEFQNALGDGKQTQSLLSRSAAFLVEANRTTQQIDRALASIDQASATLKGERETIAAALRDIAPAASAVRSQTDALTALLRKLVKLGDRANNLVGRSKESALQIIREAGPILERVTSLRDRLVPGLTAFSEAVDALNKVVPGDYLPLLLRADLGGTLLGSAGVGTDPSGGPPGSHPITPLDSLLNLLGLPSSDTPQPGGLLGGLLSGAGGGTR